MGAGLGGHVQVSDNAIKWWIICEAWAALDDRLDLDQRVIALDHARAGGIVFG